MKRKEAIELLGLDHVRCSLTSDIVLSAFRNIVRFSHPDLQHDAPEIKRKCAIDMDKLTKAKVFLLENLTEHNDFACVLCQGRGIVQRGMGWWPCVACKGTGERR